MFDCSVVVAVNKCYACLKVGFSVEDHVVVPRVLFVVSFIVVCVPLAAVNSVCLMKQVNIQKHASLVNLLLANFG